MREIVTRQEAKTFGEKYYFTGNECKYGHTTKRLTSTGDCTECNTAVNCRKRYVTENHEHVLGLQRKWREENKEHVAHYNRSEAAKASRKKWRENNKGHQNYLTRKRQKKIKQATPGWVVEDKIKQIYIEAAQLTKQEGTMYEVDHVIPLQGEIICGLHIAENLRILPATENRTKSNKFDGRKT